MRSTNLLYFRMRGIALESFPSSIRPYISHSCNTRDFWVKLFCWNLQKYFVFPKEYVNGLQVGVSLRCHPHLGFALALGLLVTTRCNTPDNNNVDYKCLDYKWCIVEIMYYYHIWVHEELPIQYQIHQSNNMRHSTRAYFKYVHVFQTHIFSSVRDQKLIR